MSEFTRSTPAGSRPRSEDPARGDAEARGMSQASRFASWLDAPAQGGAPLPEATRTKMEQSFGTGFGEVRVHEGSQAPSVGALAYTRGEQLHFAPGRYDPSSEAGQRLIGHELAHVVQQRSGRVAAPQAKGAPINADGGLEAEADAAGARAAAGQPAGLAGGGGSSGDVIQRAVGFEFEAFKWRSEWEEGGKEEEKKHEQDDPQENKKEGLHKGFPIIPRDRFTVEAEDAPYGYCVEFVVEPLDTVDDVRRVVGEANKLAKAMAGKGKHAASAYGGNEKVKLTTTTETEFGFQASPGVALGGIPELARQLDEKKLTVGAPSLTPSVSSVDIALKRMVKEPGPELHGFLTLVVDYLARGMQGRDTPTTFPKSLLTIMARTTFTKMMSMVTDDKEGVLQDGRWRVVVMDALNQIAEKGSLTGSFPEQKENQRVFPMKFTALPDRTDGQNREEKGQPLHVTTTRDQWMNTMPQRDLLSRGEDARFEGMGGYGDSTDELVEEMSEKGKQHGISLLEQKGGSNEEGQDRGGGQEKPVAPKQEGGLPKEVPLFELRRTGRNLEVDDNWVDRAERTFLAIEAANRGGNYKKKQGERLKQPDHYSPSFTPKEPDKL
jgi:hypothetical protein